MGVAATCVLLGWAAAVAGCGKRGDPLPPLRPVPARVTDLAVRRAPDRVQVSLRIPATNVDGTTPGAVDRVEVFARTVPAGGAAPTAAQLVADPSSRIAQLTVRPVGELPAVPGPGGAPAGSAAVVRHPGDEASLVDPGAESAAQGTRYYAAVGIAGGGAGRVGPPSEVVALALGELPPAPAGVSITHDETRILLSWLPNEAGQRFRVLRSGADPADSPAVVTPTPIAETSYQVPVEFGREVCFSIQSVSGKAPAESEGRPSPRQCLVPTDTYAPPTPSALQAIQEDGGVTLIWTAVVAADLAGYVVMRGDGSAEVLQPVTPVLTGTTYRDTSVQAGASYAYAVYAVDRATPPNASAPSAREVITVR